MVQAAAAQQLRSPIQVKQVSGSRGSMWPAMVLSFFTAIFAWIWYRGSGKARKSVETEPVHTETEHSPVRESVETEPVPPEAGLTAGAAALKMRREVTKVGLQKPPKDVPTREEAAQAPLPAQAGILQDASPQTLTGAPTVDDHLSQQPEAEDGCHPDCREVNVTPNGVPEAEELLHEECPPLIDDIEAVCPPVTTGEHGARKLTHDASEAAQPEGFLSWRNDCQDGINGNATDCRFENSFVVKEKAVGLLKSKENLNQDLYLEMANTLDDVGSHALGDKTMKQEYAEKCDIGSSLCSNAVKSPISLQDDDASSDESMSDVQKLGTGPESSPLDTCNLVNQEQEMAGLSNSSTDDKTALDTSSETNIHDLDNPKTKKIATIQPMPQNVNLALKVHYIAQSDSQIIAVTGDHEKLGKWEEYVPLTLGKGGFWSHLITLPVDTNLSWKLVIVENGKIKCWEECNNRVLKTAHEDIDVQLYWGFP